MQGVIETNARDKVRKETNRRGKISIRTMQGVISDQCKVLE